MSLLGRPVSQDTISHPSSLQEPPLKLEDSQGNGSLLREDSDHEGDQDESEGDGDDEEHSDPDQPEQGHPRQSRRIAKREANNDDADMSLSSDNDDDEESASMHNNDEEYSNMPEETICRWKDCGKVLPSLAELVMHLSDEHIGWKKTSYTCEWQDVPERFTGRKSRGRYTMKDPAASATLLPSSSFGAKKRRHHDSSRSDAETSSLPKKLRKLGTEFEGDHRHYHPKIPDSQLIFQLDGKRGGRYGKDRRKGGREEGGHEEDADDSDFEIDNGLTPRQRYGILKAKFRYISNERESLETEYEEQKKKLTRLRVERELLLDALSASDEKFQDPALQSIEDSD
ncbi:hypothetical protein BGX34_003177 [Mortierella sp. NVP85]|nr:hypothetical protein BGX34_003177 [Mortierella sp. NVP85]